MYIRYHRHLYFGVFDGETYISFAFCYKPFTILIFYVVFTQWRIYEGGWTPQVPSFVLFFYRNLKTLKL